MTMPAETAANGASAPQWADEGERLHILPVSILDTHSARVTEFLDTSAKLRIPLGWHYILDLAWAAEELRSVLKSGATVLDAGAGTGLMQWWLADRGVEVVSVDRMPRYFPRWLRAWCPVVDFRSGKRVSARHEAGSRIGTAIRRGPAGARQLAATIRDLVLAEPRPAGSAPVRVLEGDLLDLREIESGSVDAVVSISSLEHNSPENLARIVPELMRVMRPGGLLIATLGAARDRDWYHESSSGWCYTESTWRRIFGLQADCPSNYSLYDSLFKAMDGCAFLRENLSDFYFRSDNNCMPWGCWDPQYQSVGVVKVKNR